MTTNLQLSAQPGIEGLARDLDAAGDGHRDAGAARAEHAAHGGLDHGSGHRIDGRLPHRDLESWLRDGPHTVARGKNDVAVVGKHLHAGDDLHAPGDVRVVAAVLDDAAAPVGVGDDLGGILLPSGHHDAHPIGTLSVPLPEAAGQRRRRGTAPGGEALSVSAHFSCLIF